MKLFTHRFGRSWFAASAWLLSWAASAVCFAQCQPTYPAQTIMPAAGSPPAANAALLKTVAIGDSVVWGNGLKPEHKALNNVGQNVANMTGRPVSIVSYAHSGARLNETTEKPDNWLPGDLNAQTPTVFQQEKCASEAYPGAELILVDGCINEVGSTSIALPPPLSGKTPEQIRQETIDYCGEPMLKLLGAITTDFPQATVALYAYYRIVSPNSSPVRAETMHGQAMNRMNAPHRPAEKLAKPESDADRKQRWQDNSAMFYTTSRTCFMWAVAVARHASANPAMPCSDAPPPTAQAGDKLLLAQVPDNPDFSFGGPQTHLWKLPIPILFWVVHRDEYYSQRHKECFKYYNDSVDIDGCEINTVAHPNTKGAQAYTDSITSAVKAAWGM